MDRWLKGGSLGTKLRAAAAGTSVASGSQASASSSRGTNRITLAVTLLQAKQMVKSSSIVYRMGRRDLQALMMHGVTQLFNVSCNTS
jgi:hypothetical protein